MPEVDIQLYQDVAAIRAKQEDLCERIDRSDAKLDKISDNVDRYFQLDQAAHATFEQNLVGMKAEMRGLRTKVATVSGGIGSVAAIIFTVAWEKLLGNK